MQSLMNVAFGFFVVCVWPLWGAILLFKINKTLAATLFCTFIASFFLLYQFFEKGPQAAFGIAPEGILGLILGFAIIVGSFGTFLFLIGFVPYYYWKLR